MTPQSPSSGEQSATRAAPTLIEYLSILKRRGWIVIAALVVTPALAFGISTLQEPQYEASANVLVRPNLAATLNGIPASSDAERVTATQARLARVPDLARRVLTRAGIAGETPGEFFERSSVSTGEGSDLLEFSVRSSDPEVAIRLATIYAETFTLYRRELESNVIAAALHDVRRRIDELESNGQRGSELYADLQDKQQQLAGMEALEALTAAVVQRGFQAEKIRPRTARNTLLAGGLGVMLAIGLAFLAEALDTKVRSGVEIERRLRRPILAYLPRGWRPRKADSLVMVAKPESSEAEAFRMLRARFEFVQVDSGARSVMVTSAIEGEPKSAVAANLAVALARAGRRVILCDLDYRGGSIAQFFALDGQPGITDVALGRSDLDGALTTIAVGDFDHPIGSNREARATAVRSVAGSDHPQSSPANVEVDLTWERLDEADSHTEDSVFLDVLPLGTFTPPSPGEFVGSAVVAQLLEELEARADIVIVDTPPILAVSDALTLTATVDAMILVTNLEHMRRGTLAAVERAVTSAQAPLLGIVVTGASSTADYGFDSGLGPTRSEAAPPPLARKE